jgi:6-phosphogluconolactonase (cycloisomerase 2 family)
MSVATVPNVLGRKLGLAGTTGALLVLCAFAPPAFASGPTWLSPVKLSVDGSNAQTPVVAMDGNGDSDAVWALASGTLQTSFRGAGPGNGFAEQDVDGSSGSSVPDVAEDGGGDGEAVWLESGSVNWSYRTNDVDGFGGASGINADTCAGSESDPRIAVDSNANVIGVYLCSSGAHVDVEAVYAAGGTAGNFNTAPSNPDNGPPVPLSDGSNDASNIQIAEDPNGDATVVWQESNGSNQQLWYAYRPQGNSSTWTTAKELDTEAFDETSPTLAMDGSGGASVAYVLGGNILEEGADNATITLGHAFPGTVNNLTTDGTAADPQIADDGNGDTAVTWSDTGDAFASVSTGGLFSSAANLGTVDAGSQPQIAVTSAGDAVAVWQSSDTIEASIDTGSGFPAAAPISNDAANQTEPTLAADGQGNAVAGWLEKDSHGNEIATVDGLDGTGPIGRAHLHAEGVAGRGLTYYAEATDVWPTISISWNFGDGTGPQTGANLVHAFAGTGPYTVVETATASDGNTITASRQISLAASPPKVPEGGLEQLASPDDCVTSSPIGCGSAVPSGVLNYAYTPIVSPDGKNVYEVGNFGGLVEFSRNSTTGALTEIGCITGSADSVAGCSTSPLAAMDNPSSIALSPDGADVYVLTQGENAIITLSRNASTGLLTEVAGDCYDSNATAVPGCTANPGLSYPWGVVVSSDGKNVYATSNNGQDIAEFTRNPATGALTPIPGNNCISDGANPNGCQVDSATGLLHLIGIAADGSNVYGLAGGGLLDGDVAEFTRNPSTGALSPIAGNACIGDAATGCPTSGTDINGTEDMAIAPGGQYAYVNSFNNDAIVELHRDTSSGALSQIACVGTSSSPNGLCSTSNVVGINGPLGVAISPDGTNLYASGAADNAEAAFAVNNTTGLLTQLPAPNDCISLDSSGCSQNDATGLNGARRIAISPDGRNVYVAGQGSAAVAEFARTPIATRPTTTTGTEASWDSNDPASSLSATVTVPAISCSSNSSSTVTGQQEGARLIGSVSSGEHTSFPYEAVEVLTYCNGKKAVYAPAFVVNDVSNDTETYEPAGVSVSPGDPLDISLSASMSGATLRLTDVNTGAGKTVTGPAFQAVNGFDIGVGAIPSNGHGAPLTAGPEPDATQPSVLSGPVGALPGVFADVIVGDPPLSSAPGLYQIHWTNGSSTVATPSPIVSGDEFAGDIASVPPPKAGSKADVAPISGRVLVRLPGTHKFVLLSTIKLLPNGTIINATHGRVQITIEEPNGTIENGVFFDGEFELVLSKSGRATAKLVGGSFKGCPKPPAKHTKHKKHKTSKKHGQRATAASSHKKRPKTKVRSLWSNAHGSFGTSGQYGASAVRGTEWLTVDRCDGTFFRVTRDEITVTSFSLHNRKRIVKQGHSYLAPAPGFK